MTRQNVTEGPREILTAKCRPAPARDRPLDALGGDRHRAEAARLARNSKRGVEAYRVELEEHVAAHLIGPGAARLTEIETLAKRRFFLEGEAGVPVDHFKVRKEGKLADIAPESPVEGAEVRLELVEVGEHDMHAGVGKLDGVAVSVADASKMIGKKVKVRVERVLNGTAYATLVQPAAKVARGRSQPSPRPRSRLARLAGRRSKRPSRPRSGPSATADQWRGFGGTGRFLDGRRTAYC